MRIRIEATELEDDQVAAVFIQDELKAQCGNSGNITVSIADGDQLLIVEIPRDEANAAAKSQTTDDEKQAEIPVDPEPAQPSTEGTTPEGEANPEGKETNPEQPSGLSTEPGDVPEEPEAATPAEEAFAPDTKSLP